MGIDWETIENDPVLLAHHLQNNAETQEHSFGAPAKFSHVLCEPPVGPFTEEEVAILWAELAQRVDITTRSMLVRRQMWIHALDICEDIERRHEAWNSQFFGSGWVIMEELVVSKDLLDSGGNVEVFTLRE